MPRRKQKSTKKTEPVYTDTLEAVHEVWGMSRDEKVEYIRRVDSILLNDINVQLSKREWRQDEMGSVRLICYRRFNALVRIEWESGLLVDVCRHQEVVHKQWADANGPLPFDKWKRFGEIVAETAVLLGKDEKYIHEAVRFGTETVKRLRLLCKEVLSSCSPTQEMRPVVASEIHRIDGDKRMLPSNFRMDAVNLMRILDAFMPYVEKGECLFNNFRFNEGDTRFCVIIPILLVSDGALIRIYKMWLEVIRDRVAGFGMADTIIHEDPFSPWNNICDRVFFLEEVGPSMGVRVFNSFFVGDPRLCPLYVSKRISIEDKECPICLDDMFLGKGHWVSCRTCFEQFCFHHLAEMKLTLCPVCRSNLRD